MGWLLIGAMLAAQQPVLAERPSVIVLNLAYGDDVRPDNARTLTDLVTGALSRQDALRVVSGQELADLVELEGEKAAMGCEDENCLAEIGGALGARFAVSGRLSTLGEVMVLQLRLLDVSRAEGLSRVALNARDAGEFIAQMDSAAEQLLAPALQRLEQERWEAEGGAPPPDVRPVDEDPVVAEPPPPAEPAPAAPPDEGDSFWLSASLVSGGLALVAAGVVASAVITPIDLYLAIVVNPTLGLEDAIAPSVYVGSAVAVALGVGLALTPLFLSDEEEG